MPPWLDISIFALTVFVMLVGLFGLIVPLFPGIVVIWLAALGYGVVTGFTTLGIVLFILITLLMILGTTIDNILAWVGGRQGGASWVSLLIGTIAGIAGTLLWPPLGGLIATPLVLLLVEYLKARDIRKAFKALGGMATGWGLSYIARLAIGVVMILFWGLWAIFK